MISFKFIAYLEYDMLDNSIAKICDSIIIWLLIKVWSSESFILVIKCVYTKWTSFTLILSKAKVKHKLTNFGIRNQ